MRFSFESYHDLTSCFVNEKTRKHAVGSNGRSRAWMLFELLTNRDSLGKLIVYVSFEESCQPMEVAVGVDVSNDRD